jgi:glycosyltransferase involved in cell wall biosynthesis
LEQGKVNHTTRVVIPTVYRAGCPTIRSRLLPLCRELVPKGFSFDFLILGDRSYEVEPGICYSGYGNYVDLVRRILTLNKHDTDIILASKAYSITGLLGLAVARLKRFGYVLDVDDRTFPSEINKWWRLPLYFQEWLAERMLYFAGPETTVASRALFEYFGDQASYVPNSADIAHFSRERWDSQLIYKKYHVAPPVIIWPAVFFQEIDRRYVLEIFKSIMDTNTKVTLLVIGDGEYLPEIKHRAAAMGLDNILFTGGVPYEEMPDYYASATAGMLPLRNNHYDACKGPIKLYEYMAMELPVIATEIGEPLEMISKADCGILLPFNNPQKAAHLIVELIQSAERLQRYGKNGRQYLNEHHSFPHHAEKLLQVLERAVDSLK